jgi:hypothetical protein
MSESTTQPQTGDSIDITRVPSEDHEALAHAIESFYKQDGKVKSALSKQWELVQRMLDGDQWLVYSEDNKVWNRLTVSKENEYIPRPVTNVMLHCYQTLKSYLTKTKPRSSVKPNSIDFKDKAGAKVAELCVEANYERLKDQENYEYAASVLLGYGHVFKKDYWDSNAGDAIKLPPALPSPIEAGGMLDEAMSDAMTADTVGETLQLGDVATSIIEPFRIAIDPLATDLHTARWIMEYAIQPLDWIKDAYSKAAPGYTGLVDELKEESSLSGSMRRFYDLKNSSGVRGDALGGAIGSEKGGSAPTNSAVLKEYYEAPTSLHPKGRKIVVANGICLYAGDSDCEGPDAGDWHPYSDCRWELVPGRYWAKGPLDAICELQKRLNSIDATIMLIRKTTAIPQKAVPRGSGIPVGSITGRPGQVFEYNAEVGPPVNLVAQGVDVSIFKEREQVIEEMKMLSGAMDILTGDRPPGVNAASALALLYEVGTGKLFPMLDRWKRFIESSQKKQLKLVAKNYKEPRKEYVQVLKRLNKQLSETEINHFLGDALRDNCNVVVEAGSNVPKLEAMKQMRLQEAAASGAVDLTLPENRAEFQRQMGIVGFDNDIGPDKKRAEWENDCLDNIMQFPDKKPVVLVYDDHAVHVQIHQRRIKEPAWMDLDPAIQEAYMAHVQEHEDMIAMAQQQMQMEAMMTGQPPQDAGSTGDPTKTKSHGKGAPSDVKEQLANADVPPGEEPR